jgi:hypothetical protein
MGEKGHPIEVVVFGKGRKLDQHIGHRAKAHPAILAIAHKSSPAVGAGYHRFGAVGKDLAIVDDQTAVYR